MRRPPHPAPAEPPTPRKPLRRTAWTLLVGGLVTLTIMVGAGLLLLASGETIGPDHPGLWQPGERASVHKKLGPNAAEARKCETIISAGEQPYHQLGWARSTTTSTTVRIHCKQEATFLKGTASLVTSAMQSNLIMAPVAAMVVGVLLFFPRFTLALARMNNPRPGSMGRWLGRR